MVMPTWVIVETKSSAEELAERSLRQAGYRVYLPRFRKLLSPHGRERRQASVMRPLFARVLFAQDWRGWPDIPVSGTVGLMHVRPQMPAKLFDRDVALIMERERSGDFDEINQARGSGLFIRSDIEPGEEVEFNAFGRRVLGVLDELTEDGKALVSALLFGSEVRTSVDADAIRRVGAG
jgi:Transcription termination factor nusG